MSTASELREEILNDIKECTVYRPDRSADIRALIFEFTRGESERDNEDILSDLANCINGKAYPMPELRRPHVPVEAVAKVSGYMDQYERDVLADGVTKEGAQVAETMFRKAIEQLDSECNYYLTDTWCRERIASWLELVKDEAALSMEQDSGLSEVQL